MTSPRRTNLFAGPETLEAFFERVRDSVVDGLVRSDLDSLQRSEAIDGLLSRLLPEPVTLGEHTTQVQDDIAEGPGNALDRARLLVIETICFTGHAGLLRSDPGIRPPLTMDGVVRIVRERGQSVVIEHAIPYASANADNLSRRTEAHLAPLRQWVDLINKRVQRHHEEMTALSRSVAAERVSQLQKLEVVRSHLAS